MSDGIAATTRVVAAGTLRYARRVGAPPTVAARVARACLERDPRGRRLLRLLDTAAGRALARCLEQLVLPGIVAHYAWRKRRIARWAQAALAEGVRQVLIFGAGWDGLGAALVAHPAAPLVVEIDAPATLEVKRRACSAHGLAAPVMVAADLARDAVSDVLAQVPAFAPAQPTLVVAEGLLMYLDAARVRALSAQLQDALDGPLQLIATAMTVDARGRPGFAREGCVVRTWLRRRGEAFRWGMPDAPLRTALAAAGWGEVEMVPVSDAVDPDPAPGEWLLRARRLVFRCNAHRGPE